MRVPGLLPFRTNRQNSIVVGALADSTDMSWLATNDYNDFDMT